MKRLLAAAAALAAIGAPALAASVALDLTFTVDSGTDPADGSDAAGRAFDAVLSYDSDDAAADGSGGLVVEGPDLSLAFTFFGRDTSSDTPFFFTSASLFYLSLDASGAFAGLEIFVDEPNTFFFGASGTGFSYDFQEIVSDPEFGEFPETVAAGNGTITVPAAAVIPLPAGAPLLLLGLGALGLARRR